MASVEDQKPNTYFSATLHEHPLSPLAKEHRGLTAAIGRMINQSPMICALCHLPCLRHKKVLTCSDCNFFACGNCSKKHGIKEIIPDNTPHSGRSPIGISLGGLVQGVASVTGIVDIESEDSVRKFNLILLRNPEDYSKSERSKECSKWIQICHRYQSWIRTRDCFSTSSR